MRAKLSNTFPCYGMTGVRAESCPGCCAVKRLRNQAENQLLNQSSQTPALSRGDSELVGSLQHQQWWMGSSRARSDQGDTSWLCRNVQAKGGPWGLLQGGWVPCWPVPAPAAVCQGPPWGMLPCLSAKNIWGQQLPFSLLGMIQPYEFHFMWSKDKLYLQIKHSSYLCFFL